MAAWRLQPGTWLLDDLCMISGLWEILHQVSLAFSHSRLFKQRLHYPSLPPSQPVCICAPLSVCIHPWKEVFSTGEFAVSNNIRCLHRSVFPPVLNNFLFPIIYYLCPLQGKVKCYQTKAQEQPALGQEPRESSNLQLSL